jgi:drug/metabolite transporter (DMT)-like permease
MSNKPNSLRLGLFLAAGLLSFAFAPIIVRLAGDVNPIALAVWRTTFAVFFISPFYLLRKEKKELDSNIPKRTVFYLKILSGAMLGLHFILWISSLKYTSVASASVLVTIHPIILIVAEQLIFKVKFNKIVWAGVFLSFIGSVSLGLTDSHQSSQQFPDAILGDILAFLAAAVFAIYFLISRKIRQHTTWMGYVAPIYFWAMVTCVFLGLILPGDLVFTHTQSWVMVILMAVGPQLIGHGSMNYAVKYVSPTILSTTILVEPALATVFGAILFNEVPTILAFSVMTLIIAGVFVTWFGNSKVEEI